MDNPLASNDPAAWNALVNAVHPDGLLVAIAHRMGPELRGRLAPEDIFQDTLFKAWRARNEFAWQGIASFRRWLLRTAERCIEDERDSSRAQKRDQGRTVALTAAAEDSSPGSPGFEPWTSTTPSRVAGARERARAMELALKLLSIELREVVRLRLFEDLTMDEIATRLEIGESAARYRFRKGAELYLANLKHALGQSSVDGERIGSSAGESNSENRSPSE